MNEDEKKLRAEEIIAESFLGELIIRDGDYGYSKWEKYKDNFLQGKISFETWTKYYDKIKTPIEVELPGNGILISKFSDELAEEFKNKNKLFYRSDSKDIVEIGNIKLSDGSYINDGFIELKPARFITVMEKYFNPWTTVYFKSGKNEDMPKSMNQTTATVVLASPNFIDKMPVINRIFPVQMPIIYDGKLTFPKDGYDKRFGSWLPYNAPKISNPNMTLEKAKEIIYFIYKEFCFQEHKDYINAIAGLLTPFLRGLYPTFNTRAPIFGYLANRERAGKDFCAGITGSLYEGQALEEPPISDGEYKSSGKNDELKKKILAAMIMGRKRLHFANNKGKMNSAVFEAITTAEKFSDRKLGKNEILTFDNELDFSFSGNLDIRLTPDLANRCRIIRLFLEIEDANARKFDTPNLHKWVRDNRNIVLSALYALVRNWVENKMPEGSIPFSSFPQWAKICGGVMESAGYDNPCEQDRKEMLGISLDNDTDEMKTLFEYMFEKFSDKFVNKHDIIEVIKFEGNLFNYIDWNNKGDQTRFGIKLNKFVGRILSDIRLIVKDSQIRTSRWQYKFTKESAPKDKKEIFFNENDNKNGNLGNFGNLLHSPNISIEEELTIGKKMPRSPRLPISEDSINITKFTEEELKLAGLTKEDIK